jgi:ATP:ADP antiporter, AAA family
MAWKVIQNEFLHFGRVHWFFAFFSMVCCFGVMFDYGIVRPVANSCFITVYGSELFPYAWLAIVPLSFFIVDTYNRFLFRLGIFRTFLLTIVIATVINSFSGFFILKISFLPFFFYVWKEIYVMLLFQQLWSVIHMFFQQRQARGVYGLILSCGGIGGILGNLLSSSCAVKMGSNNLLFYSLPIFLTMTIAFYFLSRIVSSQQLVTKHIINNFLDGLAAIRFSKPLSFILLIVLFMQVTTTIIYYQFNWIVETSIHTQDLRTAYIGQTMMVVNVVTVFFQLVGSFLFLYFLGLKRSHLCLPIILLCNTIGCLVVPSFFMIAFSFVTIKAFDFSFFNVLKELLYIPLKVEEKFQAKSVIDVFVYRSSKAIAAIFILVFQFFGLAKTIHFISWAAACLLFLWVIVVYIMYPHKEKVADLDA